MKKSNWKNRICALLVIGTAAGAAADETNTYSQGENSNMPPQNMAERMLSTMTAQEFVTDAAMGGMKEVRLSELALTNSQNNNVRGFAERMIRDHSQANNQLARLAQQKDLNLPGTNTFGPDDPNWNNPLITETEPVKSASLLKTNLALVAYTDFKMLKQLSGNDFDRAYAKIMVMDHVNTVIAFEAATRIVQDPQIKQFAQRTLPTLRDHLHMAHQLANELSPTAETDTNNVHAGMTAGSSR